MKYLFIIVLITVATFVAAQDSTTVANTKLIEIATETRSLRQNVEELGTKLDYYTLLNKEYKDQVVYYQKLKEDDDKLIGLMRTEISLRTDLYSERLEELTKPKSSILKEVGLIALGIALTLGISAATN